MKLCRGLSESRGAQFITIPVPVNTVCHMNVGVAEQLVLSNTFLHVMQLCL